MNKERNMSILVTCEHCGKDFELKVNDEDWIDYYFDDSLLIQEVFPYLTAGERELLLNQMCEDCWNKMFADIADLPFMTVVGKGVE